jgi:flagellar protein FliS
MLFEGALRFLDQALAGFSKEDPAEFHSTINNNILRAQAIIQELDRSLDLDLGGELAVKLRSLYEYFNRRLFESNRRKQPEGIREVSARLSDLRNAWVTMLRGQNSSATPAAQGALGQATASVSFQG